MLIVGPPINVQELAVVIECIGSHNISKEDSILCYVEVSAVLR